MKRAGSFGFLVAALAGAASWIAPASEAYRAKPLPAHTGGFGEPSCQKCHWDAPLDDPSGSLSVSGLPSAYQPGGSHRITLILERPGLRRAGFEIAARFEGGVQAGAFTPVDDRVLVQAENGIQYATHTELGTAASTPGSVRWTLDWSAPDEARGPVVFHVAANASDDDDSELGDFIYLRKLRIEPASGDGIHSFDAGTPSAFSRAATSAPALPVRTSLSTYRIFPSGPM